MDRVDQAPGRSKQILHGISGYVRPGEMLAVMGPSGCGKTTMLNVLSQKLSPDQVEGSIRIGNHVVTKRDRRNMGFVFQDDLMLSNLTVRETILTSAELKLPVSLPSNEKKKRVDALISVLGLSKVRTGTHRVILLVPLRPRSGRIVNRHVLLTFGLRFFLRE